MINVVVLAAGLGKRMHSSLPKVLQPIAGSPMIHHVLKTVQALPDVSRTVVVIGHELRLLQSKRHGGEVR